MEEVFHLISNVEEVFQISVTEKDSSEIKKTLPWKFLSCVGLAAVVLGQQEASQHQGQGDPWAQHNKGIKFY